MKLNFQHHYSVFSVTWSENFPICWFSARYYQCCFLKSNISHYYPCWELLCWFMFCNNCASDLIQDSLLKRKFKRKHICERILLISYMSLLSLLVNLMCPCWIKIIIALQKKKEPNFCSVVIDIDKEYTSDSKYVVKGTITCSSKLCGCFPGQCYGCIVKKKVILLEELKRDTPDFGGWCVDTWMECCLVVSSCAVLLCCT